MHGTGPYSGQGASVSLDSNECDRGSADALDDNEITSSSSSPASAATAATFAELTFASVYEYNDESSTRKLLLADAAGTWISTGANAGHDNW